jgi:alpha-L-fucosidase
MWLKVLEATTIGHKRILKIDSVETKKIKVNITDSKACSVISNIEVY